jgi:hypothetical protein
MLLLLDLLRACIAWVAFCFCSLSYFLFPWQWRQLLADPGEISTGSIMGKIQEMLTYDEPKQIREGFAIMICQRPEYFPNKHKFKVALLLPSSRDIMEYTY